MRFPGLTSRMPGSGSGAHRLPALALVGAVLALGLAFWGGRLAEAERPLLAGGPGHQLQAPGHSGPRVLTRGSPREPSCVRVHGVGFDTWVAPGGAPSFFPGHARGCTARGGRGGFPPDAFAAQRWGREWREGSDTALERWVRYPVTSVSARSGLADQPPVVTRPLRGPPARG